MRKMESGKRLIMDVSNEFYDELKYRAGVTEDSFNSVTDPARRQRKIDEQVKLFLYEHFGLERPMSRDERERAARAARLRAEAEELEKMNNHQTPEQ